MKKEFDELITKFKQQNNLQEYELQTLLHDVVAERERKHLLKNKLSSKMLWGDVKQLVYTDCVKNISDWIDYNAGCVDGFKGSEHLATVFAISKEEALNDIVAYRSQYDKKSKAKFNPSRIEHLRTKLRNEEEEQELIYLEKRESGQEE